MIQELATSTVICPLRGNSAPKRGQSGPELQAPTRTCWSIGANFQRVPAFDQPEQSESGSLAVEAVGRRTFPPDAGGLPTPYGNDYGKDLLAQYYEQVHPGLKFAGHD